MTQADKGLQRVVTMIGLIPAIRRQSAFLRRELASIDICSTVSNVIAALMPIKTTA